MARRLRRARRLTAAHGHRAPRHPRRPRQHNAGGANIAGALPSNGFGEITNDFTTEDALFSTAVAITRELPGAEHVLLVDGWHLPDARRRQSITAGSIKV